MDIMNNIINDTTLDNYYEDADTTFTEAFAIVRHKMLNNIPLTTAKQELMDDFIKEWTELFGYDSLK